MPHGPPPSDLSSPAGGRRAGAGAAGAPAAVAALQAAPALLELQLVQDAGSQRTSLGERPSADWRPEASLRGRLRPGLRHCLR